MSQIITRKQENSILNNILLSNRSELLALYGRRRIGKTHLIRHFFNKKGLYFEVTGLKDGHMSVQLNQFANALSKVFFNNIKIASPTTWLDALMQLDQLIQQAPEQPIILFFDELPWLATPRSQLLQSIDHMWNTEWQWRGNIKLILCGSAASWILDHLINAKGGLHNRISKKINLQAFDLVETNQFLKSQGINLHHKQLIETYLVTGGVAHYLLQFDKKQSVAANIQRLYFDKDGALIDEFPRLFSALFKESEVNLNIIKQIAKKYYGVSRSELVKALKMSSGGTLNQRIAELSASGFIKAFIPYGFKQREVYYKVIDEYSLFYLKWIDPVLSYGKEFTAGYWQSKLNTPSYISWSGYAFESLCLKHVELIRQALNLQHTACTVSNWRYRPQQGSDESGAQIDLLFDRDDDTITLCEIKYSDKPYKISKEYAKSLAHKIDLFIKMTKTKKRVELALITSAGFQPNLWSEDLISASVNLSDLC